MERWCETACAVADGYRLQMSPVEAAVAAVNWQRVVPDIAKDAADAAARTSAGTYDAYSRRLPHVGGRQ